MDFIIGNRRYNINREDILSSTKGVPPKPFDGRNKYYVELHGMKYPIKQPIHLTTGLDYTADFTAQYASRILKKLGFAVLNLVITSGLSSNKQKAKHVTVDESTVKLAITLEHDEDGYIIASVPVLPGCHSQGRTDEEAIANIREAIRGYVASMRRHGEELPNIKEVREIEVPV